MSSRQIGIVEVLLSGICFGFLGLFGKFAYERGIQPTELLSLRFLVSAGLLGIGILVLKRKEFQMKRKEIFASILLGLFGLSLFSSCYFFALQYISASLTVLLLYCFPVLVAVGARFIFREQLGAAGILALIGSSAGLVLLLWGDLNVSSPLGLAFGFGSAVFYALYILLSRAWLKTAPAFGSVFFIQIATGILLGAFSFRSPTHLTEVFTNGAGIILGVAIISSLLAMTLFLKGLQKVSSAEVSILSTSEPLTAVLLASLFLNERLSNIQYLGGLLVISSMIALALRKRAS